MKKDERKHSALPDCDQCCRKLKQTFPELSEEEIRGVITPDTIKYYRKGELIYPENARIKGCYFIYSGVIRIYQTGHEGKEQIMRFGREGDIFGFRSVLRHEPACSSVKSHTEMVACYIPDLQLITLIKNNPGFAYSMLQIACKELGDSNRYIRDIAQKSVKKRLAEALLLIAGDFGLEEDGSLKLDITREELSNFVGTATETIIRLLSEYKQEGIVEPKGRKIRLLDIEKLRIIAEI